MPWRYGNWNAPGKHCASNGDRSLQQSLAEPVRRAVPVLQVHAGVVEHDAADAGDLVVVERRDGLSSSQSNSGSASSSMNATMSPAAARIPMLRDIDRFARRVTTSARMCRRTRSSTSAVWSVDGPLTTTTSKCAVCLVPQAFERVHAARPPG